MNDSRIFKLPDLGEGLVEAEVIQWHVSVGDHVTMDQPLVSVETDKAVIEIPAPRSGTVAELFVAEGDPIEVGAALLGYAEGESEDPGAIVGKVEQDKGASPPPKMPGAATSGKEKVIPAARALAESLGIDLAAVTPTGPGDVITEEDVRCALGGGKVHKLTGARKAMAANMARAADQIVPASVSEVVDVEDWIDREEPMLRLIRAMVRAAKAVPALNAWFDGVAQTRTLHDHVNLGFAVDTEEGLFVPVIADIDTMDAEDIRFEIQRLREAVHTRTIGREDMQGATLSLSNFGAIGGKFASMVVVPPQVCIVGAGRIREEIVLMGNIPAAHRMLPLSLTFDHRVVTGGEATRFLAALVDDLTEGE